MAFCSYQGHNALAIFIVCLTREDESTIGVRGVRAFWPRLISVSSGMSGRQLRTLRYRWAVLRYCIGKILFSSHFSSFHSTSLSNNDEVKYCGTVTDKSFWQMLGPKICGRNHSTTTAKELSSGVGGHFPHCETEWSSWAPDMFGSALTRSSRHQIIRQLSSREMGPAPFGKMANVERANGGKEYPRYSPGDRITKHRRALDINIRKIKGWSSNWWTMHLDRVFILFIFKYLISCFLPFIATIFSFSTVPPWALNFALLPVKSNDQCHSCCTSSSSVTEVPPFSHFI